MTETYIPYGAYWSTPFARWQGSMAHLNAVELAAHVAKDELARRSIEPAAFDYAVLGMTVPQHHSFFGAPWLMGMIGAEGVTGPTINQACATSARCLADASREVGGGMADCALVMTADRTSNGPHVYYPNPKAPGGTGAHENWVVDNFGHDPHARVAMIDTAENVAKKYQITTEEQHDVAAQRYAQYEDARKDHHAFQKRYMTLPFGVPDARYRKALYEMPGDEGIHATTPDGLAKLKPVLEGGTVTYGSQTHPADGSAAAVVTTKDRAKALARDGIVVRIAGYGQARTEKAHMPQAPVPAARRALEAAGWDIDMIDAVKSHNPFAVNDIVFSRETGFPLERMNNYGCSLVWGHPQGPTGLRAVIELIEELAIRGGGRGLFHGCAAGDSAMAVAVEVAEG